MDINIRFYVRYQRMICGIKLKVLSAITGISKSYLSAIQNGRKIPRLDIMIKIALALNCKIDDLCQYSIQEKEDMQ